MKRKPTSPGEDVLSSLFRTDLKTSPTDEKRNEQMAIDLWTVRSQRRKIRPLIRVRRKSKMKA